ncbi:hypothetical protein BJF78_17685 [Pseudonocardia sp. CNS-139]|nr:hypothetical protein BJF78_17685 [Pseudonocardia sp. CNS-139]
MGLVVSALRDDNPGPGLQVLDSGDVMLVLAPDLLRATAASLRWHLGPRFGLADLEAMVLASSGTVRRTGDTITWRG